jgi:hypothetical protein
MSEVCPFKPGDMVVYTPSGRGAALDLMTPPDEALVKGQSYLVESIENGLYIVVRGYGHPGSGLFWSEFSKP